MKRLQSYPLIVFAAALLAGFTSLLPQLSAPAGVGAQTPAATAYVLELETRPAAAFYAEMLANEVSAAGATAATIQHVAEIDRMQDVLASSIQAVGAPILYRTQRVYNGIAVLATPAQLEQLARLPGVKAAHRIVSKAPDLSTSVPFIGAPALWQGIAGLEHIRGEGMRIAIIDTGIDYLHADFGGPAAGYAQNDRTRIGDVPGFPSTKVVGGYDFAGDRYNADSRSSTYSPVPAPDPDPMDCYGHGTHVAGIAAGYGVTQTLKPYQGPWGADTPFGSLRIGPGVAPLAELYALKVFGCAGSSDIVDLAIEWSVDPNGDGDFSDRVDVINLSLGSPLGELQDPTTVAANNAAAIGVVVVASAGNSADNRFVLGSPSNGDRVISVAASQHGVVQAAGGEQRIDAIAAFSSRGPRAGDAVIKPDLAAPGSGIVSASNQTGSGSQTLSGTSMAAPQIAGAVALLRQLHPTWTGAEIKALAMNTAYPLVRAGLPLTSPLHPPSRTGAGRIDLMAAAHAPTLAYAADAPGRVSLAYGMPAVWDDYAAAQRLRIADKSGKPLTYTLTYAAITDMPGVTITLPISQIAAPANGAVDVPVLLDANAASIGRTSLPPPAEVIAAGRQWFDEESGHVLLWPDGVAWHARLANPITAADHGQATFGYLPASSMLAYTIAVTDIAPSQVTTVTIGMGNQGDPSSPLYTLYRTANGPLTLPLTGTLAFDSQYALFLSADGLYLEFALDTGESIRGQLVADARILHVPLHAAPRPVASVHVETPKVELAITPGSLVTATLAGHALGMGVAPTDVVSLASVFQLDLRSPNTRPAGLLPGEVDLYDSADISHVGVASTLPAGGAADAMAYFAIAAHAPWASPNVAVFNILIDIDGDGADDFRLFNSSREGYFTDIYIGDSFVSALENLRTGRRVVQGPLNGVLPAEADTRPYQSRVLVMPLRIADLGLALGNSVISYRIESFHRALGSQAEKIVDRTPVRRLDLAHPALDVIKATATGSPLIAARPGVVVNAPLDLAGFTLQRPEGLLIFHHHNAVEEQVDVVEARFAWPASLYLPQITR